MAKPKDRKSGRALPVPDARVGPVPPVRPVPPIRSAPLAAGLLVAAAFASPPSSASAQPPAGQERAARAEARRDEPLEAGAVRGRVLGAELQRPIAGASVEVRAPGRSRYAITDAQGAYVVTGLPPGPVMVEARAIDRRPLLARVVVAAGVEVSLDLALERRPVVLPVLFAPVRARRLAPPSTTRDGFRREGEAEHRALEASPGVIEAGLSLEGRGLDAGDPNSVLYVRGAASDLKLVLLDGAPVYAPFHLSGLLDAFPDSVLADASLYVGGTPARYDGGLSYVLDLKVREGDPERLRLSGMADMLSGGGRVEGPLGRGGRILLSGRALHGLGYPFITAQAEMPYGYGDALLRVDHRVGSGVISGTGFWNRESVRLDDGRVAEDGGFDSAYWGNLAGSLNYGFPAGGGRFTLRAAYGRFVSGFPLPRDKELDPLGSFADARGSTSRTRAEALFESGGERFRWAAGGGYDTHDTVLDERSRIGGRAASLLASLGTRARVTAGWGEAVWQVVPQVELKGGFRASHFGPGGGARFAPRGTATWHITDAADLRLSAGRFYQVVHGPESILSGDLTGPVVIGIVALEDGPVYPDPPPDVAGAYHLVVGLENSLENGVDIGVEAYFKSFEDLPDADRLRSSGADLWVQAKQGPVQGWVGYSVAWVWTTTDDGTAFVGRQLLSGGLQAEASELNLGVRLAYGAGLPFTSLNGSRPASGPGAEDDVPLLSGAPDDSYLRLDAEISRRWTTRVGDASLDISPYLRVLNALDRRDALFYQAGADETLTRAAPLASLPVIAVVGVSWSF